MMNLFFVQLWDSTHYMCRTAAATPTAHRAPAPARRGAETRYRTEYRMPTLYGVWWRARGITFRNANEGTDSTPTFLRTADAVLSEIFLAVIACGIPIRPTPHL